MQAFQLTGIRDMDIFQVPDPVIERPIDVVIRMGAIGVCGSDIHYYATGRIGSQVVEYPFTVGHECAGTIVEVGPRVDQLKVGDRVAVEPAMTCGQCDQCQAGRENTCRRNRFLGCPGQAEGSMSDYLVMPQQNCFKIPDDMTLAEATVSEPLAIAIYAVKQAAVARHHQVGILGMGPIGRTIMLAAMSKGCQGFYCSDKIPERCAATAAAGATWVGNPLQQSIADSVLEQESLGLDIVFECCGQQDALDAAVDILRPGGTLMIVGIPEVDSISFKPERIRRKELTIINVRRQRECVPAALELITQQRSKIDQLITHSFGFAESKAAFDLVADYRDGVVKAMIEFD